MTNSMIPVTVISKDGTALEGCYIGAAHIRFLQDAAGLPSELGKVKTIVGLTDTGNVYVTQSIDDILAMISKVQA